MKRKRKHAKRELQPFSLSSPRFSLSRFSSSSSSSLSHTLSSLISHLDKFGGPRWGGLLGGIADALAAAVMLVFDVAAGHAHEQYGWNAAISTSLFRCGSFVLRRSRRFLRAARLLGVGNSDCVDQFINVFARRSEDCRAGGRDVRIMNGFSSRPIRAISRISLGLPCFSPRAPCPLPPDRRPKCSATPGTPPR